MNAGILRAKIAAHRDTALLRAAATLSRKFLRAYDNLVNWDPRINGEIAALERIAKVLPGVVLDVGANEGQWASAALEVLQSSQDIHCFEIVPQTFAKLLINVGNRPNVHLNSFGLGAATGEIDVNFYPDSSDRTSAFSLDDGFRKETVHAKVIAGDEYLAEKHISQVAYLKIDVEGMEMEVLAGFERSLRAASIAAVQFEHGGAHVVSRHFLQDFLSFFRERNYQVYRCFPHRLCPVQYNGGFDESFVGQNFVALSERARRACGL